jgi:hypothetical protein
VPFLSDKRLYLNADKSKVVEEDDPDASYLLVAAGGQVSDEHAKQYGLKAKEKAEAKAEEKAESEPAETKQVSAPPENKSRSAEATKDK